MPLRIRTGQGERGLPGVESLYKTEIYWVVMMENAEGRV